MSAPSLGQLAAAGFGRLIGDASVRSDGRAARLARA